MRPGKKGSVALLLCLLLAAFHATKALGTDRSNLFARQRDGYETFKNIYLPIDAKKVYCIFQNERGLMWFGTSNGLYSYNGYNLHSYSSGYEPNGNVVNCILQKDDSHLRLGTDGGLLLFDMATRKFSTVKEIGLKVKEVRAMAAMEYYIKNGRPSILANACWGSPSQWVAVWDEGVMPFSHFTSADSSWSEKFHLWRMDWDSDSIRIYMDGELLNDINLSQTFNQGYDGNYENPFSNGIEGTGFDFLLNLAIGSNSGAPDTSKFPLHYYINYVRAYQLL